MATKTITQGPTAKVIKASMNYWRAYREGRRPSQRKRVKKKYTIYKSRISYCDNPAHTLFQIMRKKRGYRDPEVWNLVKAYIDARCISMSYLTTLVRSMPRKNKGYMFRNFRNGVSCDITRLYILLRPVIKRSYAKRRKEIGRTTYSPGCRI